MIRVVEIATGQTRSVYFLDLYKQSLFLYCISIAKDVNWIVEIVYKDYWLRDTIGFCKLFLTNYLQS